MKVSFEVVGHERPSAIHDGLDALRLGLQLGRDEVVQEESAYGDGEVRFGFDLEVRLDDHGVVRFRGPAAQGKADDPFVYLTWGVRSGAGWTAIRRAKLPIGSISWSLLEEAAASGEKLRARLGLTDAKGGPVCASQRQISWTL